MSSSNADTSKIEAAILRARALKEQSEEAHAAGVAEVRPAVLHSPSGPSTEGRLISMGGCRRVRIDREVAHNNRILSATPAGGSADSQYRMLRTRLMQRMRSNRWRVLGVTATGEGEGKTLTAINLAISIAAEVGQEALLVELDLRRPSIYSRLGISPADFTSLTEYLENPTTRLEDLLFSPESERLGCLLSSHALEQPSDLLASPRSQQMFKELRERLLPTTVIIVDLPPLLSTDDALVLAPMLDALLYVVAEGQTRRSDLAEARHILREFNVVGTMLNKSVESDPRKYYR